MVTIEIEHNGDVYTAACSDYKWTSERDAAATMLTSISIEPFGPPTHAPSPDRYAATIAIGRLLEWGITARIIDETPGAKWVEGRVY
jgi:hypothetical protein